jgi:hypothetical protein
MHAIFNVLIYVLIFVCSVDRGMDERTPHLTSVRSLIHNCPAYSPEVERHVYMPVDCSDNRSCSSEHPPVDAYTYPVALTNATLNIGADSPRVTCGQLVTRFMNGYNATRPKQAIPRRKLKANLGEYRYR